MRVFLDTNIIMEYLCNRANYRLAKEILNAAYLQIFDAYMSSGCLYTLSYLLARHLKEQGIHEPENTATVRETLNNLMDFVTVADAQHNTYKQGLNDLTFKDLEDSYQYYCAIDNYCDLLITFNMKHFAGIHERQISLIAPDKFIDQYIR